MKTVKIFLVMLFAGVLFSSCYEKTDDRIDNAILDRYFREVWQPETKKFK